MAALAGGLGSAMAAAAATCPSLGSLSGVFDLGIAGGERAGQVLWLRCRVADGRLSIERVREAAATPRITHELGTDLAIRAALSTWIAAGDGRVATLWRSVESLNLEVAGNLPYFIRHVALLPAMLVWFASAVAKTAAADTSPSAAK